MMFGLKEVLKSLRLFVMFDLEPFDQAVCLEVLFGLEVVCLEVFGLEEV